ncbi:hypothetical protein [Oceanibacterium hippocampi]|uniref:Phage head-tail joining protein n=1 Tax=Oceanibacterium hippocampi TaxID=745714 RepID=A0A1Y5SWU0_9PROT|nr:hypothetical protein [Oceanibacterium hippocampi]SLN50316.1 hypothetical protein OCH7691_02215 [Oceanibacterium hippocampi]
MSVTVINNRRWRASYILADGTPAGAAWSSMRELAPADVARTGATHFIAVPRHPTPPPRGGQVQYAGQIYDVLAVERSPESADFRRVMVRRAAR